MARARNIKPGFFTNEELVELGFGTRLLFIGLWTIADRAGRLEDRPKKIKMALFPADDMNVNAALDELQKSGFLLRYEHDGARYIQVLAFNKHQNPHKDEKASLIPPPCGHGASTVQEPDSHGGNRADSLIPDSLNLIPDTGTQEQNPSVEQKPLDPVTTIFAYWQKVMDSPGSVLDDKRRKLIAKALKGYSPADVCKAIRGCSKTPHNMGENDRKTKYNGLGLILRDADHIDRFILCDAGTARAGPETIEQANARIMGELLGTASAGDVIDMEPA